MHFGEWLRREIGKKGMGPTEFAAHSKIPRPSLNEWLGNPAPKILPKNLKRLADGLGSTFDDVEAVLLDARDEGKVIESLAGVPILGGISASQIRGGPHDNTTEWLDVSPQTHFFLRVQGDCMEPDYRDGDYVLFDSAAVEREGMLVGRDYAFFQSSGVETFKRIKRIDPEVVILVCSNVAKHGTPLSLVRSEIVRAGKAKSIVRGVPRR